MYYNVRIYYVSMYVCVSMCARIYVCNARLYVTCVCLFVCHIRVYEHMYVFI
jgi:hypothetical protein